MIVKNIVKNGSLLFNVLIIAVIFLPGCSQADDSDSKNEITSDLQSIETSDFIYTYLFENSQTEVLSDEDIIGYDKVVMQIGINEIYARHGYRFNNERWQKYFADKAWYQPSDQFSESHFSDIEKKNIAFLKSYETVLSQNTIKIDFNMDGVQDILNTEGVSLYDSIDFESGSQGEIGSESYTGALVTDLDITDHQMEILIFDAGPSSDNTITVCEQTTGDEYKVIDVFTSQYFDYEIYGNGIARFEIFQNMLYGIGTFEFFEHKLSLVEAKMPTFKMNESIENIFKGSEVNVYILSEADWSGPFEVTLTDVLDASDKVTVTLEDYQAFMDFMEYYLKGFTYMYYGD